MKAADPGPRVHHHWQCRRPPAEVDTVTLADGSVIELARCPSCGEAAEQMGGDDAER